MDGRWHDACLTYGASSSVRITRSFFAAAVFRFQGKESTHGAPLGADDVAHVKKG